MSWSARSKAPAHESYNQSIPRSGTVAQDSDLIGRVNNLPCLLHSEKSYFIAELGGRMWQNRSLLVEGKAFMPNDTLPVSSVEHDCE